jgi:hypothetical protein
MRTPGFEAEASLFSESLWATVASRTYMEPLESRVQPASISSCFQNCDQICEGDPFGRCMPWCICRCHGGRHCGLPS